MTDTVRVLIIEDDLNTAQLLELGLRQYTRTIAFDCERTATIADALEKAKTKDVVLADVSDIAQAKVVVAAAAEVPVVVITDDSNLQHALAIGVHDVMPRQRLQDPLAIDELARKIHYAALRAEARRKAVADFDAFDSALQSAKDVCSEATGCET